MHTTMNPGFSSEMWLWQPNYVQAGKMSNFSFSFKDFSLYKKCIHVQFTARSQSAWSSAWVGAFSTKQVFSSDGLSESFTNHTPPPSSSYLFRGAGEGPSGPGNPQCLCASSHLQTGGLPRAAVLAGVFGNSSGEGFCGIANEVFRAVRSSIKRSGHLGRRRVSNAPYWKFCSQASWGKERTVAKITLMFNGFFT